MQILQDILHSIPWAFLLAFSIGPGFFVLLETSITKGFRAAMALDFGIVVSDIIYILIAYLATEKILEQLKDNPFLFVVGGAIMFGFGIISYIQLKKKFNEEQESEKEDEEVQQNNYLALFFKGFLLNVINIGILGFWMMVILTQGPRLQMDSVRIITFFSSTLILYLVIDIVKIMLAKQVKDKLTPVNIYKIKRVISFILIIFGGFFILQGLIPDLKEKGDQLIHKANYKK